MPHDATLYVEDICALKTNPSVIGVIDRTHSNIDSHDPYPGRELGDPIRKHAKIPRQVFKQFMQDGVPPLGTVLVEWTAPVDFCFELLPEKVLTLLDRPFRIGDTVKKHPQSHMSGVVVKATKKCTLKGLDEVRDTRTGKTVKATYSQLMRDAAPIESTGHDIVSDVPASELQYAHTHNEGDLILYGDWIGRVDEVVDEVTLQLYDNSIVAVDEALDLEPIDQSLDRLAPGDFARTRKANLRTGRWIYGAYNPNLNPLGVVVQNRTMDVRVDWLYHSKTCTGGNPSVKPHATVGFDDLESGAAVLYDRARRPRRTLCDTSATLSTSDIDLEPGVRVMFRDLAGACIKYDGTNGQGKVNRSDRRDTMGYDMNIFTVVSVVCQVTVQWQDLSVSVEPSIALAPDSTDDENALYPGEIVCSHETLGNDQSSCLIQPSRIGIAQAVDARERVAKVRWCPDARVQFLKDEETPLPDACIGRPSDPQEEVSIYDIHASRSLNFTRGDFVFVRPTKALPHSLPLGGWIGEVVDHSLDGLYTVRLGAAVPVQDIQVPADGLLLAFRVDDLDTDDSDDDDDAMSYEYDSDDDALDEFTASEQGDMEYILENETQVRNSIRHALAGDDEDEAWSTENEEDDADDESDEEDVDSIDGDNTIPVQIDSIAAPRVSEISIMSTNDIMPVEPLQTAARVGSKQLHIHSASGGPLSYAVLETDVPADHHFSNKMPPQNLKDILKEHKILRTQSNLPDGVYVRTWESRMDLLRVLFVGPLDTPYAFAPFVFDICLPSSYPVDAPAVFFHSWGNEGSGQGRVNPNLYEDGKVCLSLLGTWNGDEDKGESWTPGKSTVLQVLVSLLGLVLVREPYFNEAGYETLQGLASSRISSALYSERTHLRARGFLLHAVTSASTKDGSSGSGIAALRDVIQWLYLSADGPGLVDKAIEAAEDIIVQSEEAGRTRDLQQNGMSKMSRGACLQLKRLLLQLEKLKAKAE